MDSIAAAQAGAQFEGLLLGQLLRPLGDSCGQFGSFVVSPLAQSIAAHDEHGFGALLAGMLRHGEE